VVALTDLWGNTVDGVTAVLSLLGAFCLVTGFTFWKDAKFNFELIHAGILLSSGVALTAVAFIRYY
jgi:hypothetical protein